MRSTTVFPLLAIAYATVVAAVPMPEPQGVWAVPAQDPAVSTLEARDPKFFGPKKWYPGEMGLKRSVEEKIQELENLEKRMMWGASENEIKRDVGKPGTQGQGQGFDLSQSQGHSHTIPQGPPPGMPEGGPQGAQGQGMGGVNPGQGKPDGGKAFGAQGKQQ